MKYLILLLFMIVSINFGFGCDCREYNIYESYNLSDVVSIAKIKNVTDAYFEFEVLQNYKAKSNRKTYVSILKTCSLCPEKGEIWLLFSNFISDDTLYTSSCLSSCNLKNPISSAQLNWPEPPLHDETDANLRLLEMMNKDRVYNELFFTLTMLEIRSQNQHDYRFENELLLNNEKKNLLSQIYFFLIIVLFTSILNTIAIVYLLVRK